MKLTRTEAREKIMIILYQIDFYIKDNISFDVEEVIRIRTSERGSDAV